MIVVRVPHLPKLQRSIPLTGTLFFTRTSHTVRVFLFLKNKATELRLHGFIKKVEMVMLMCWCLPFHSQLIKNHNAQYGCNERCNHHDSGVIVGKEGPPERNQYDKQGKQYGSNSSCVHGFVF